MAERPAGKDGLSAVPSGPPTPSCALNALCGVLLTFLSSQATQPALTEATAQRGDATPLASPTTPVQTRDLIWV